MRQIVVLHLSAMLLGCMSATTAWAQPPSGTDARALWRYYNPTQSVRDHLVSSAFELNCGAGGYNYEGIAGYALTNVGGGAVTLSRFVNNSQSAHFLSVTGTAPSGFVSEGILGYIFLAPQPGTVPLVQAHHTQFVDYLYTTNPGELSFPPDTYVVDGTIGHVYAGPPGAPCDPTCTVLQPTNNQQFNFSDSAHSTAIVTLESRTPGLYARWTGTAEYTTSGNRGPFYYTLDPASTFAFNTTPIAVTKMGGRLTMQAADSGAGCSTPRQITVGGDPVSTGEAQSYLLSLYSFATPNLVLGLAHTESFTRHFCIPSAGCVGGQSDLYGVHTYWPHESHDGGSHVGLTQQPVSMQMAWDWKANAEYGVDLLTNYSMTMAISHMNQMKAALPSGAQIRNLSATELENMALKFYRWGATGGLNANYYRTKKIKQNQYDWERNVGPGNPGIEYVTAVRGNCVCAPASPIP